MMAGHVRDDGADVVDMALEEGLAAVPKGEAERAKDAKELQSSNG